MRGRVEGDESLRVRHQFVCLSEVRLSRQLCQVVTLWPIGLVIRGVLHESLSPQWFLLYLVQAIIVFLSCY
jgi:hypothetical protein